MAGYTRQSAGAITSGATIEAAHHNAEFNALEAAFSGASGHGHGGGSGDGPKISLTAAVSGTLPVANGGTGGATAAAARTSLGLVIGTNVQAYDAGLADIAALAVTDGNFIVADGANWVAESGSTARTSLGLGSIATQNADSVTLTGGTITGITDLAVADGGTGASTAADARTNLGVAVGTDVQAHDDNLDDIAGLATTDGGFIVGNGAAFVLESGTTARASLGLGTMAVQDDDDVTITGGTLDGVVITNSTIGGGGVLAVDSGGTGADTAAGARTNLGLVIGTNVQAYDAELAALAGLTSAADKVPYFTGSGTAALTDLPSFGRTLIANTSAADARSDLSLGSIATQNSNSVTLTGGTITGITDLAVADGGTGASNAADARTNLGLVIGTDVQAQGATLTSLEGLSLVQGDLLYATAADTLARLAKGTALQQLAMNSGATAPEWINAQWDKLGETALSGASDYTLTGIGTDYDDLVIILEVLPSTDTNMRLQTHGADGVLDTGGSDYAYRYSSPGTIVDGNMANQDIVVWTKDDSETYIVLGPNIESNTTTGGTSGVIYINNIQASRSTLVKGSFVTVLAGEAVASPVEVAGVRLEAARISGVKLFLNSGTMSGRVSVYGRKGV